MTDFETIRYEVSDGIAHITLARPDKRNAVDERMFTELAEAADLAGSGGDILGVLVFAEGPSFCAGIDLSLLAELGAIGRLPEQEFRSFADRAQRPFRLLAAMAKPTLAAVQGHALGAGFQLALACDLRVAAADARFAVLEGRYGLIPDLGGMHHLARLVGPSRAKELVWSGRTVEAAEAERIGLVNRVVALDSLAAESQATLVRVIAHSPIATGLAKALIDTASETAFEQELEREAAAQAICITSDDHREAVAAFLEKRVPEFRGR